MNRPWMPLHIADYLRDTSHLRATESGAYLHLIMAYWVGGKLPNDDRQLATIAKLTDKEWRTMRPTLEAFFGEGFSSHKRIDKELSKVEEISNKRKASAEQRWCKTHASADASAHTLNTKHITKKEKEDTSLRSVPDWPSDFKEKFWDLYPKRVGKKAAINELERVRKRGDVPWAKLIAALTAYAATADPQFTKDPERWLKKGCYDDEPDMRKSNGQANPNSVVAAQQRLVDKIATFGPRPSLIRSGSGENIVRMLPPGGRERPGDLHGGNHSDPGGIPGGGDPACDRPEDGDRPKD